MARIIDTSDESQLRTLDKYQYDTQTYNGLDCCITVEVWRKRLPDFKPNTWMTYLNEKDIQAPALEMQLRGIHIDESKAYEEVQILSSEISLLESYFAELTHAAYGEAVNWRSPAQLKKMFNNLGFKIRGTDRDTLEGLRIHFFAEPIVNAILALRDRDKLRSNIANSSRKRTGRWHAAFKVAGTVTGRLSSSKDPFGEGWNLQNINDRTRRIFIPPEGYKLGYVDLEQAESRAVAYLSGDENYIAACESGDLHTIVCRMVWPELEWTGDLKKDKAVASAIFYRFFTYRDMSKRGGHGCLTEDHEVLTPDGWMNISDVPDGTPILAWDQHTNKIQWETPSHWERKPWYGDLYEIEGRSYSMKATSDHRMPLQGRSGAIKECPAEALSQFGNYNLPLQGRFVGGNASVTENQARLCAAAQADAHIYDNGSVRWGFSRHRKQDRLEWLLGGRRPHITEYTTRDEIYYHLPKDQVDFPIAKYAGAWMLDWPLSAIQAWVDELKFWDGTIQNNFTWIYSKNREHAWWMYFFCRMTEQGASYCDNEGHDCARVGLNRRSGARISSMEIAKTAGNGTMVYCPTVPSSGFVVRRKGHVMFSLNTNYYGKAVTMAKHLKVPRPVMEDFQARYLERFSGIPEWWYRIMHDLMTEGWLMTPFGRYRRFFGRPEDDATIRKAIAFEPQSLICDVLNTGLWRIWKNLSDVKILAQVHDAVFFMFPEEAENEIIPQVVDTLEIPISVNGRTMLIPAEPNTGWNWGHADDDNPSGIKQWDGNDDRERPRESDILDARCR